MIGPMNPAASVINTEELAVKNMSGLSPGGSDEVRLETGIKAVAKQDKSNGPQKYGQPETEKAAPKRETAKAEVRKVFVEDGKITVNVYDSNGKLLRKTPPGYLPLGEQGFDITV